MQNFADIAERERERETTRKERERYSIRKKGSERQCRRSAAARCARPVVKSAGFPKLRLQFFITIRFGKSTYIAMTWPQ